MAKKAAPPIPVPRNTYNLESYYRIKRETSQLSIERLAFAERWPVEKGGLPRIQHYHNMLKIMFPGYVPHADDHWAWEQDQSLCEEKWISWTGAAGAAKTCRAALFAVVWWLAAPRRSSVILTTSTKKALKQKMWPEVLKFFSMLPRPSPGNMVQSQTVWQADKGDDKHAIIGIAVESGPVLKAVTHIQGVHTIRQLVIIDEATDVPIAISEACYNLFTYPEDFQLLEIANPQSRFDPHGLFSEPKDGWKSVSIAVDEWETTPKLDGRTGVCLRFDAAKSPNIVAGKVVNKHLITKEKYEQAVKGVGENNPRFWKYFRGFWAPDGLLRTVFTESLIIKMDGFGKHIFAGTSKVKKCGIDPAFGGGDRAIQRFGSMGWLPIGKMGLQLEEEITLLIDATSTDPVHYQLARQIINNCEDRGVEPKDCGIDSTGEGGGLADVIQHEWELRRKKSANIVRVEFGGSPSDLPASDIDKRPCNEVYDRRVTELWHVVRQMLIAGQLKGIDASAAFEFCNRQFDEMGKKIKLESKQDMKDRMSGRSPDCADSCVVLAEVCRRSGMEISHPAEATQDTEWVDKVAEYDTVNAEIGTFD